MELILTSHLKIPGHISTWEQWQLINYYIGYTVNVKYIVPVIYVGDGESCIQRCFVL